MSLGEDMVYLVQNLGFLKCQGLGSNGSQGKQKSIYHNGFIPDNNYRFLKIFIVKTIEKYFSFHNLGNFQLQTMVHNHCKTQVYLFCVHIHVGTKFFFFKKCTQVKILTKLKKKKQIAPG